MNHKCFQAQMNRRCFLRGTLGVGAGLALGASGLLAGCGSEEEAEKAETTVKATVDGDIEYFGWAEYFAPEVVTGFEAEYGVKVKQTYFDSDEAMVQKVAAGLPYDVICTNSAYIPRMIEGNLLVPLDHEQLENWGQVVPFFQDPVYDPGAKYSVPYGYCPTGISYLTAKIDSASMTESWDDLWTHREEAKGKIFILEQIEEVLGASLLRLGYSHVSDVESEVVEAADELIALKPYLAGFSSDYKANLASGNAWIHQSWVMGVYQNLQEKPNSIIFETCGDDTLIGSDLLSIGINSKSPGTSMLFIDWCLKPENSVANVQWMSQGNGTTAGIEAAEAIFADYPMFLVDSSKLDSMRWKESATEERLELWNREWTRVKAS